MSKPTTPSEMGRKGGLNRASNLTADERRQIAQRGVRARWERTQPHVDAALEGFDASALARHIEARMARVPSELRAEVRRRALREAVRQQAHAVASSIDASSSGSPL